MDALVTTAQVIMGIQTIVSRRVKATDPLVLTIGTIRGGDRYNVVPEEVVLEGTCRTHSPEVTARVPELLGPTLAASAHPLVPAMCWSSAMVTRRWCLTPRLPRLCASD